MSIKIGGVPATALQLEALRDSLGVPSWQDVADSSTHTGYDIRRNLLVDLTGGEDATAHVLHALNTYGTVIVAKDVKILVDLLDMPNGACIQGQGEVLYKDTANTGEYTIRLGSGSAVKGVTFRSQTQKSVNRIILWSANCERPQVHGCKFVGGLYAEQGYVGYETWVLFDQGASRPEVVGCDFAYGASAIFGIRTEGGRFDSNLIVGPTRCISMYGGKRNKVRANIIKGRNIHYPADEGYAAQATVTGINFLTFGFLGVSKGIIGNEISGNHVSGISEEAIGLDTHGNNVFDAAENQILALTTLYTVATDGGQMVLTLTNATTQGGAAAPADWWDECYVNVLSGAAVGATAKIISGTTSAAANTAQLRIAGAQALALAPGDVIQISYGISFNSITGNTVEQSMTGILLWGSAWHNTIANNTIKAISRGVVVASVVAGYIPGADAAGKSLGGTVGYSGPNRVHGNTIVMEYEGQPTDHIRAVMADCAPIVWGTWAYGTPSVAAHNPGAVITDNNIVSGRDCLIGGALFATAQAGAITLDSPLVSGNRVFGGGSIAINNTRDAQVLNNYKGLIRQDYNKAASANNANLQTYEDQGEGTEFRKAGGVVAAYYYGEWKTPGASYRPSPWTSIQPYSDRLPVISQKISEGVYGLPADSAAAVEWEQTQAMAAGIDVFIHNAYWFEDPAGQPPGNITHGSIQAHATCPAGMKFAIQWSNHGASGIDTLAKFNAAIDYMLVWAQAFPDNYWTINGKPVLYIFSMDTISDISKVVFAETDWILAMKLGVEHIKARAVAKGLPGLFVVAQSGHDHPLWTGRAFDFVGVNEFVGCDAQTVYNRHSAYTERTQNQWGGDAVSATRYPAELSNYAELSEAYRLAEEWIVNGSGSGLPMFSAAIAGWDRRPWLERDSQPVLPEDNCAPSPEQFLAHLRQQRGLALAATRGVAGVPPVVNICAWNEYGEGSFLCPTRRYGWSLLEQVTKALGTSS